LRRVPGPLCFETPAGEATRDELRVVRADRGVRVAASRIGLDVELVEHLFGALAGLGVQRGIALSVHGPEVPLLDGAALEFAMAIAALAPPRDLPKLRVVRDGRVEIGASTYDFAAGPRAEAAVSVAFPGRGTETASWDGSVAGFVSGIARARTFGFRGDYAALREQGRAAHVDPHSVLVLEADGRVLPSTEPEKPNELALHKLLDLLGDLYLFGGPALGRVNAIRPGHTATHAAVREALERGILARV
jgi:UDP-3-O-[3-hydroxymyristoyl] N-acetylglucosamine deacetylase